MHPSGVNLKLSTLSPSSDWRVNSLLTDRHTRVSGVPVDSATRKWPTMKKFFCSMSIPGSVVRQTDERRGKRHDRWKRK
jgi:hypothetical protein